MSGTKLDEYIKALAVSLAVNTRQWDHEQWYNYLKVIRSIEECTNCHKIVQFQDKGGTHHECPECGSPEYNQR